MPIGVSEWHLPESRLFGKRAHFVITASATAPSALTGLISFLVQPSVQQLLDDFVMGGSDARVIWPGEGSKGRTGACRWLLGTELASHNEVA